jgi:hypothetical protein
LIFTDPSDGRGSNDQIPGCLDDLGGPELLPERNVEFAAWRMALD